MSVLVAKAIMVFQYILYGEKAIHQKTISFVWTKGKLHRQSSMQPNDRYSTYKFDFQSIYN